MGLRLWRATLLGAFAVGAAIGMTTAPGADARSSYESPYGYDRTWNAALRLVRVDNGWKVTEKDDQSGYLLFEYRSPESAKTTPGSFELIRGSGRDAPVSVLVQLAQMPHYHEQVLLDTLAFKMRREYGDPPLRRRSDDSAPPDAGDAGGD